MVAKKKLRLKNLNTHIYKVISWVISLVNIGQLFYRHAEEGKRHEMRIPVTSIIVASANFVKKAEIICSIMSALNMKILYCVNDYNT